MNARRPRPWSAHGLGTLTTALVVWATACNAPAPPELQGLDAPRIQTPRSEASSSAEHDAAAEASARDGATASLDGPSPAETDGPVVPRAGAPSSFADLVERVRPAVVNIYTTQDIPGTDLPSFGSTANGFRHALGNRSLGSGFLIDDDGLILTSGHVIERAREIRIVLADGRSFDAEVVGLDARTDIALVRIPAPDGIQPLPLGDCGEVRVGDWVIAVGNPFGLASTVTAGIVSAIGRRDLELGQELTLADFLQTDASINPGNSGGPLVNMRGEAIGINTAINREGQGIGFAIPSRVIQAIIQPLRDEGRVRRAWLGIRMIAIDDTRADANGIERGVGVRVTQVTPGGPAARAGLARDDLLVAFDDLEIRSTTDLRWTVGMAGIGSRVPITLLRDGERRTVHVVLGRMPEGD